MYETHCHLNHPDFESDWKQTVERAAESGVRRLLVVGYDLASSRRAVSLCLEDDRLYSAIGIHPDACEKWGKDTELELSDLARNANGKVVAIGEIGLDYYRNQSTHASQVTVLRAQLALAKRLSLPVIIHCREAYTETIDILQSEEITRAVLHCFTGTEDEAQRAVELGYFLGIGGILTFKKSDSLRATISSVPPTSLLLETDCPYLAPQKWRGKRNEPAYLTEIIRVLSEVTSLSVTELNTITSRSAEQLFEPRR